MFVFSFLLLPLITLILTIKFYHFICNSIEIHLKVLNCRKYFMKITVKFVLFEIV